MKKPTKLQIKFWVTFAVGVTFAYFMWLTWRKLTVMVGDSNIVWGITGGIVLIAMIFGYFSFKTIVKKYT